MANAYTPELYVDGRRMLHTTNVSTSPEGGDTEALFGMLPEPVGVAETPTGMSEITMDIVPKSGSEEYQFLLALRASRKPVPIMIKAGVNKDRWRNCICQPRSHSVEEGASRDTVSFSFRGIPVDDGAVLVA